MCIAKVDITTQAVGVIAPEKNITQLGTMVTGEIVAVNFKQGDVVKKGDIIITINICKIKILIFLISNLIKLFQTANNFWSND